MTTNDLPFASPYRHDLVRVAAAVPLVRLGDPHADAEHTVDLARQAHDDDAAVVCSRSSDWWATATRTCSTRTPCWTPPSTRSARCADATSVDLRPVLVVGAAPAGRAPALQRRRGRAPRTGPRGGAEVVPAELPRVLREAALQRGPSGDHRPRRAARRTTVPFGTDLLFDVIDVPDLVLAVEICEDVWVPVPPSTLRDDGGRHRGGQPLGQQHHIGKAGYRRQLCSRAIGPHDLGLRLRGGRAGRVDHRPRVGRPRASSPRTATCWRSRSASGGSPRC